MILLDSDVMIEIFDQHSAKGGEALRLVSDSGDSVGMTAINLHELVYGRTKRSGRIDDLAGFPVLPYTQADALVSSKLEAALERKGATARRADAMIASIAIGASCPLYTFDKKHFEPMREFGLQLFP